MLNKVELIGRLGADPEQRTTTNGHQYARFSIPLFHGWGNQDRKTSWVQCEAWNKVGEIVMSRGGKGKLVRVEGELCIDSWEANGERRSRTYIRVQNVIFLNEGASNNNQNTSQNPVQNTNQQDDSYMTFNQPANQPVDQPVEPELPEFAEIGNENAGPDENTLEELFGGGFQFDEPDKN